MLSFKKNYLNNLMLLFFLLSSVKVTYWLTNSLGGDDLSYWIFNTSLIIDKDWVFIDEIYNSKINLDKSFGLDVPLHSYGSSFISIPFVSLFYLFDIIFDSNILSNPILVFNSFMYLGYFLVSSFSGIFSIYVIKRTLEELNLKFSNISLFVICLGSSYYYFIFNRFTLNHTFEVLVNSLIIFTTVLFLNQRKKKFLVFIAFLIFLSLNLRISNYNVLIFPLFTYFLYKELNKKAITFGYKDFGIFSIFFLVFFLTFGIINNFLYGSIIRNNYCGTKLQCEAFIHPYLGQNFSDVISNLFDIFKNIDGFLFSFGPGLIWSFPTLFFIILFLYLQKIKLHLKLLFLLSISIPLATTLFWRGRESEFNPRLLIGLIPIVVIFYFYQINSNHLPRFSKKAVLSLSTYNVFNQFFFHTNEYTTLSKEISYLGLNVEYSNKNINYDILFQFFENLLFIPSNILKSLFGVDLVYLISLLNNNFLNFIIAENNSAGQYIMRYHQINIWILILINLYILTC